jgi:hypothetical protein
MTENDSVTKESPIVTKEEGFTILNGNGIQKLRELLRENGENQEKEENHLGENSPISENVTKPKRKREMRISLYLNEEKVKLLYSLADCCGVHRSRIDDRQGSAIWQMLEYMEPVLIMRNQARDMARKIGLKPEDLR